MNPSMNRGAVFVNRDESSLRRFARQFTGATFIVAYSFGMMVIGACAMAFLTSKPVSNAYGRWQSLENKGFLLSNIPDDVSQECYTSLVKRISKASEVREDGTVESTEVIWSEPVQGCGPEPYLQ